MEADFNAICDEQNHFWRKDDGQCSEVQNDARGDLLGAE